jgi:glyoxylase-like metal-dependent hydrolase (beta-lactamase superfamily II)
MKRFVLALLTLLPLPLAAQTLHSTEVAPGTYAIQGPFGQRDAENLGNNATFGLIVTDAGAVLVDAGASFKGAQALDEVIKTLTDQPVTYVINTGGQDHRWLGNSYWQAQGAQVIASDDAVADQKARGSMELTVLDALMGKAALAGTTPAYADISFGDHHSLTLGGREIEITHPGPAHTPGDSYVWLPAQSVMFTGDIVFVGRILGVLDMSSSKGWVAAFDDMAAHNPKVVVPGHGPATDLATARHDTYDYLTNLRTEMATYIEGGGEIIGSVEVDQSAFSYLQDFDMLAKRNAQAVFSQMEWE